MKKTVGEINFNEYYLRRDVCNCKYDEDDYDGTMHRWCPLNCPLRDENTKECLLDLINERLTIENKIKRFENVEIEVDEERLKRIEKLQGKDLFTK